MLTSSNLLTIPFPNTICFWLWKSSKAVRAVKNSGLWIILKLYLIDNLFVVTGFQEKEVRRALTGLNVKFIHNPSYETGQASSVTVAIENLPEQYDSALIGLADMPFVTAELIDRLIETHNLLPKPETRITLPLINGERSNPVIWGKAFFDELQNISGDQGGRQILSAYLSAINGVSWEKMQIAEDIDIPEDRNKLSSIHWKQKRTTIFVNL